MALNALQAARTLTRAECKVLWANETVHRLTEKDWKAFTTWIDDNDPNVPQAQQWLLDNGHGNDTTFVCALLLMKLAQSAKVSQV